MTQTVNVVLQETLHPVTVTIEESTEEIVVEVANVGMIGSPGRATPEFLAAVEAAEQAGVDAAAAKTAADEAQAAAETAQALAEEAAASASGSRDLSGSYAGNAESSATAAETASSAAVTARNAAQSARDAAITARQAAETASSAAVSAKNAAETASSSSVAAKDLSETARDASESARDDALESVSAAESARDAAVTAKSAAETARDASVDAKSASETARDAAVSAKNAAETAQSGAQGARDTAVGAVDLIGDYAAAAAASADDAAAARDAALAAGLILEWDGTAYPARGTVGPKIFEGTVNPDDLGLMLPGDVWINPPTNPETLDIYEVYQATLAAKNTAVSAASNFPANGLAYYDVNTLRNADFKQSADGLGFLLLSSSNGGVNPVRVSDPDYTNDYYLQLTNPAAATTGNNVIEFSSMGRIPWKRNERWFFSIDVQSDVPMQLGGTFLPSDISNVFITTLNTSDKTPSMPGDGAWYRHFLAFDTNAWPANTAVGRIRMNGVPAGATVKVRRPKFGRTPVYINPSDKGVTFSTEFNRYERVGLSADDLPWLSSVTPKQAALLVPDYNKQGGWRWTDTQYYEGGGSPEGVVTAAVGSEYVDTANTNGAKKWRKATGTGNTGWKVIEGDTGWRTIASWNTAGVFTTGSLPSNMTPTPGNSGSLQVRRIQDRVIWRMSAVTWTNSSSIIHPTGFGPGGYYVVIPIVLFASSTGFRVTESISVGATPIYIGMADRRTDNTYYTPFEFQTDTAWPTVLPGV